MKFFPIILTIIAGLSTLIGLLFTYVKPKKINRFIAFSLAFSAGIILTISIFDLLPSSTLVVFASTKSYIKTILLCLLLFLTGYCLISLFKKYESNSPSSLYRVGVVSFFILFFHNALEGIATYSSAVYDINMGISLTTAIIMHNIPEGILIAIPIYYTTKSRLKAFKLVLVSALAEPIGAIISYLLFRNMYTDIYISFLLIVIAGLMISLVVNEILKELKQYNYKLNKIIGFVIGAVIMLINIFLFH